MSDKKSFLFGMGLIAGVVGGILAGVCLAPKSGKESREELKEAAVKLYEDNSPAINDAKKQALENVDLMKYKFERQLRKMYNSIQSKKLQKAKELESDEDGLGY
ncbi:MAG: YtxH domain-containing protein [Candidatus Gastranaerophilales bacterium]